MENTDKNTLLAMGCFIAAVILGVSSSTITGKLAADFGEGWFQYVMITIGVCLDFGKFAFTAVGVYQLNRGQVVSAGAFFFMAAVCITISFLASMAYDLNRANEIANKTMEASEQATKNSDSYKKQNKVFSLTTSSIEDLRKEIENKRASEQSDKNKIHQSYKNRIAFAKKKNIYSDKNSGVYALEEKRDTEMQGVSDYIKKLEDRLHKKESALSSTPEYEAKEVKVTEGVYGLAAWMNPKNPELTLGRMVFVKNMVLEIAGIFFSGAFGVLTGRRYISKIQNKKILSSTPVLPESSEKSMNFRSKIANAVSTLFPTLPASGEKNNQIFAKNDEKNVTVSKNPWAQGKNEHKFDETGMNSEIGESNSRETSTRRGKMNIDDESVKKYVKILIKNLEDDKICPGYKAIAKEAGFTENEARSIYNHLKMSGYFDISGSTHIKNLNRLKDLVEDDTSEVK
jgi:hypothetical protein